MKVLSYVAYETLVFGPSPINGCTVQGIQYANMMVCNIMFGALNIWAQNFVQDGRISILSKSQRKYPIL
jgi:hypothetical protein